MIYEVVKTVKLGGANPVVVNSGMKFDDEAEKPHPLLKLVKQEWQAGSECIKATMPPPKEIKPEEVQPPSVEASEPEPEPEPEPESEEKTAPKKAKKAAPKKRGRSAKAKK